MSSLSLITLRSLNRIAGIPSVAVLNLRNITSCVSRLSCCSTSSRHLAFTTSVCPFKIDCVHYSTKTKSTKQKESSLPQEDDVLYKTIIVEVSSHDPAVLKSYEYFAATAASHLNVEITESSIPPKVIERTTLPKSRHVYGKYHKVQYERRTHYRKLVLKRLTGSTADTYLEYIQRNLPEGVAMKVTKTHLEKIPDHIKPPT